jgi:hypothetical protein
MITNRFIEERDYPLLEQSLSGDEFHKDTPLSFFLEEGTVCSVYEDENGPILFVRGKPAHIGGVYSIIRLDIQFLDNYDAKRNMRAMLEGLPELESKAKSNGFEGLYFYSNVPLLRKFCTKRLGFKEFGEEVLYKVLDSEGEYARVPHD